MRTYDNRHETAIRLDENRYMLPKEEGKGFIVHDQPVTPVTPDPTPYPVQPRPERARVELVGTYTDRAKGFAWATWQIATVVGIAAAVLAWWFGAHPIASGITVVWLISGYLAVWLIAFALHTIISPEGAEVIEVLSLWHFLRREQDERHRRYRIATGDDPNARPMDPWVVTLLSTLLGAALAGGAAVIVAAVLVWIIERMTL